MASVVKCPSDSDDRSSPPSTMSMRYTLEHLIRGLDTIAATGNILRDNLTYPFSILELGHQRQDAIHRAADGRRRNL